MTAKLKRNKKLEKEIYEALKEQKLDSLCSKKGHPNAEYQDVISSASGALYYCPDCDTSFYKPLNQEQQEVWNKAITTKYDFTNL